MGSDIIGKVLQDTYQGEERRLGFDSFAGVAEPTDEDRLRNGRHFWHQGKLSACGETAFTTLAPFTCCQLVRGWIPHTFGAFADRKFRLMHIDVDLHDATRDSLEFFYTRMVSGGIFPFDDHGFVNYP